MNKNDLHILLHQPHHIAGNDANDFNRLLSDFPYFQSVRSLYLKSLYLQKSQSYNLELKKTAAYTRDRDTLFDFITSLEFTGYKPISLDSLAVDQTNSEKEDTKQYLADEKQSAINSLLDSINTIEKESISTLETQEKPFIKNTASEELEIINLESRLEVNSPLKFSENEKHSFHEWLQLASTAPIERNNNSNKSSNQDFLDKKEVILDDFKQKKIDLIDKFIETNPKIPPTKKTTSAPINIELSIQENSNLMTETLARIYLEQKKYQKAIQAYEILILKYPEKSSFFANQISDIKALQQYNSL